MTIRHLLYALEVARSGSISKAAQKLLVSQPYLSGMLNALEKELGYILFSRSNSGVSLTPEGQRFIRCAKRIAAELTQIQAIRPSGGAPLRVAAYYTQFITERFILFRSKSPGEAADRIREMGNMEVLEALAEHTYTLGLIHHARSKSEKFRTLAARNNLVIQPLLDHLQPVAVMGKGHAAADAESLSVQDFIRYPYVSFDDESTKLYLQEHLKFGTQNSLLEVSDRAAFSDALASGQYLSIINMPSTVSHSRFLLKPIRDLERLADEINVTVSYLHHKDYVLSQRDRAFLDFIKEQAGDP